MKRSIILSSLSALIMTVLLTHVCANSLDLQYSMGLFTAQKEFIDTKETLNKVVNLIEKGGIKGLAKHSDPAFDQVFVLDPTNGKVLFGGEKKANAYYHINGKLIVQQTIQQWQDNRSDDVFASIDNTIGDAYRMIYSRFAITQRGKLYVVAVGKQEVDLEHLFITRLVDQACDELRENGLKDALNTFSNTNGIFRTQHTYIFVYADDKRCLCNPNYPELVGKTVEEMTGPIKQIVADFLQVAKKKGSGWIVAHVRNPKTDQEEQKEIYVKRFNWQGTNYTVGSGIYGMAHQ